MNAERSLILVVDDDADWSDVLAVSLKKLGYRTHLVPDTKEARSWLAANRPALVILDVMMPDGNGLDLCRWIRGRKEFERLPIIVNSGIKDEETAELALELGAVDFLHKPVNLDTLRRKIERLLAAK